jgi:zinc transport system substrate-binding protein
MEALAGARAWIVSGAEFEIALRPKVEALFPALRIVNGVEGVTFRTLEPHDDEGIAPDHGEDDGIDRHTWLGREPAKLMVAHILETLTALDAGNERLYRENYEKLIQDIDDEFDRLKIELAPLRGTTVFVYHPAFGYFLDEFDISQTAVETGGKEPTPRLLARLAAEAREQRPKAIFVQAQFPVQPARTLAEASGAELIALDPLAPDWLANIRRMGEALRQAAGSTLFKTDLNECRYGGK